jgi:SPP1 family predicted phage head-tail adaptor
MVRAGELNRRIDLQAPSRTPDGMGGSTVIWTLIAGSVPAAIWPVSGKELIAGGREATGISHRIRIRYRDGVRPSWRIYHKGKYFNIISIINPGTAYKALDIMAKEVI